jgi:16S rRNA (adenine1518-N6/adenine1519-N6)-dimethyltransferase
MHIKPQKSYGQHFLKDENVLKAIANAIKQQPPHPPKGGFSTSEANPPFGGWGGLIEIGPGMGALTRYLIEIGAPLTCIEVDKRCVEYLRQNYLSKSEVFKLIEADFLKVDLNKIIDDEAIIVGNFPYNISSQIIFKILDVYKKVPTVVGMFQKEVAERLAAKHGNKTYGITSILTQLVYDVEVLFDIPPESFAPPPKVISSVIRLTRKKNIPQDLNYPLFKSIVKTSFNQRRKMMRSSLKQLADKTLLQDAYFDLRPEQLSVEDFIALTQKIEHYEK